MSMEEDVTWIKQQIGKLIGGNGIEIIHDTALHEGEWVRIGMIEPSVFSILATVNGNELVEALTFDAGTDVYGKFRGIQLLTGAVIAYID